MKKVVKILLALATAVASLFTAVYCAYPFLDSWADIVSALASWEAFGYRLTLTTVVRAVAFGVAEGLAIVALTVSGVYVIQQVAERQRRVSQPMN